MDDRHFGYNEKLTQTSIALITGINRSTIESKGKNKRAFWQVSSSREFPSPAAMASVAAGTKNGALLDEREHDCWRLSLSRSWLLENSCYFLSFNSCTMMLLLLQSARI
jgi:hypothetical protein